MATLNDAGIDASISAAAESSLPKKPSGSWRSGIFSRKRRQSEDKKRSDDSEADAERILVEDAADRSAEVTVHAGDEVPEDAKALARKLSEALGREVSVAEVLERRMAAAPAAALAVAKTMSTDVALALAPAPSRPRSGKALWQKAQTRRASIAAMSHQFSHRAKEKAAVGLAEAGVDVLLELALARGHDIALPTSTAHVHVLCMPCYLYTCTLLLSVAIPLSLSDLRTSLLQARHPLFAGPIRCQCWPRPHP